MIHKKEIHTNNEQVITRIRRNNLSLLIIRRLVLQCQGIWSPGIFLFTNDDEAGDRILEE